MDVGIECVFPLVLAELKYVVRVHLVSVVVEQDVNGAHCAESLVHHFPTIISAFQIGCQKMTLSAVLLH